MVLILKFLRVKKFWYIFENLVNIYLPTYTYTSKYRKEFSPEQKNNNKKTPRDLFSQTLFLLFRATVSALYLM